jgi:hypothetical protein
VARPRTGKSLAEQIPYVLSRDPTIDSVVLTGSRARGQATELSDWDFEVETSDFPSVAQALPALVAPLAPLAQQWDRLSPRACYMLMLRGVGKVDLIFDEPHAPEPPWEVSVDTLRGIDDHLWDWTIWLAAKDRAGKRDLVAEELTKMHEHLLGPLGVQRVPQSVRDAVAAYTAARAEAEERSGTQSPRAVEDEVRKMLAVEGYAI